MATVRRLGCIYGGARSPLVPITPSSSVPRRSRSIATSTGGPRHRPALLRHRAGRGRIGLDRHGLGAGWNGARAFTATSGPGVSLMTEFIGLAYFAEIPVTIINVQRGGPPPACRRARNRRTCLPAPTPRTATQACAAVSQDPHECFEQAAAALDCGPAADAIFLMTDLDIG